MVVYSCFGVELFWHIVFFYDFDELSIMNLVPVYVLSSYTLVIETLFACYCWPSS